MRRFDVVYASFVFAMCVAFVPVWFFFMFSERVMPLSAIFFDFAARALGSLPAGSHKARTLARVLLLLHGSLRRPGRLIYDRDQAPSEESDVGLPGGTVWHHHGDFLSACDYP